FNGVNLRWDENEAICDSRPSAILASHSNKLSQTVQHAPPGGGVCDSRHRKFVRIDFSSGIFSPIGQIAHATIQAASDYGAIPLRWFTDAYYGVCYGWLPQLRKPLGRNDWVDSLRIDQNVTSRSSNSRAAHTQK